MYFSDCISENYERHTKKLKVEVERLSEDIIAKYLKFPNQSSTCSKNLHNKQKYATDSAKTITNQKLSLLGTQSDNTITESKSDNFSKTVTLQKIKQKKSKFKNEGNHAGSLQKLKQKKNKFKNEGNHSGCNDKLNEVLKEKEEKHSSGLSSFKSETYIKNLYEKVSNKTAAFSEKVCDLLNTQVKGEPKNTEKSSDCKCQIIPENDIITDYNNVRDKNDLLCLKNDSYLPSFDLNKKNETKKKREVIYNPSLETKDFVSDLKEFFGETSTAYPKDTVKAIIDVFSDYLKVQTKNTKQENFSSYDIERNKTYIKFKDNSKLPDTSSTNVKLSELSDNFITQLNEDNISYQEDFDSFNSQNIRNKTNVEHLDEAPESKRLKSCGSSCNFTSPQLEKDYLSSEIDSVSVELHKTYVESPCDIELQKTKKLSESPVQLKKDNTFSQKDIDSNKSHKISEEIVCDILTNNNNNEVLVNDNILKTDRVVVSVISDNFLPNSLPNDDLKNRLPSVDLNLNIEKVAEEEIEHDKTFIKDLAVKIQNSNESQNTEEYSFVQHPKSSYTSNTYEGMSSSNNKEKLETTNPELSTTTQNILNKEYVECLDKVPEAKELNTCESSYNFTSPQLKKDYISSETGNVPIELHKTNEKESRHTFNIKNKISESSVHLTSVKLKEDNTFSQKDIDSSKSHKVTEELICDILTTYYQALVNNSILKTDRVAESVISDNFLPNSLPNDDLKNRLSSVDLNLNNEKVAEEEIEHDKTFIKDLAVEIHNQNESQTTEEYSFVQHPKSSYTSNTYEDISSSNNKEKLETTNPELSTIAQSILNKKYVECLDEVPEAKELNTCESSELIYDILTTYYEALFNNSILETDRVAESIISDNFLPNSLPNDDLKNRLPSVDLNLNEKVVEEKIEHDKTFINDSVVKIQNHNESQTTEEYSFVQHPKSSYTSNTYEGMSSSNNKEKLETTNLGLSTTARKILNKKKVEQLDEVPEAKRLKSCRSSDNFTSLQLIKDYLSSETDNVPIELHKTNEKENRHICNIKNKLSESSVYLTSVQLKEDNTFSQKDIDSNKSHKISEEIICDSCDIITTLNEVLVNDNILKTDSVAKSVISDKFLTNSLPYDNTENSQPSVDLNLNNEKVAEEEMSEDDKSDEDTFDGIRYLQYRHTYFEDLLDLSCLNDAFLYCSRLIENTFNDLDDDDV